MKSIFLREDGTYASAVYEFSHREDQPMEPALMDAFPEPWVAAARYPRQDTPGIVTYHILDGGVGEDEVVRRVRALAPDTDVKMVAALPDEEPTP